LLNETQVHPQLARRPIAAQYGVYAHLRSYNSATESCGGTGETLMIVQRRVGFALIAALVGATAVQAAELPSQHHIDKSKNAEAAKKCNVAGSTGVVAGNGVCVKLSGYVTSQFGAGQLK
jgi:hypothetical protein